MQPHLHETLVWNMLMTVMNLVTHVLSTSVKHVGNYRIHVGSTGGDEVLSCRHKFTTLLTQININPALLYITALIRLLFSK